MPKVTALLVTAAVLVAAPAAMAATPKLSATWPTAPTAGQQFAVVAQVKPARKGVRLSLQQKAGSRWKTLASGTTDKKGVAIISARLAAGKVSLRISGKAGSKSIASPSRSLSVTAGGGSGGGGSNGPLFTPPGRDLVGDEAARAIVPYLTNATFTDCVAGWPSCAVESRYGYFASGNSYYCRLTSNSGSDIINGAHPFRIIGAEMKADGSWGVSLEVTSYGGALTYYEWQVGTNGVANGAYWGPSNSIYANPGSPSEYIGPLQWVRGARDCSY